MAFGAASINWLKQFGRSPEGRLTLQSRVAIRLALILLPVCAAAGFAQYSDFVHTQALRESVAMESGEATLMQQRNLLQEVNIFLETISASLPSRFVDRDDCQDLFRRVLPQSRHVTSLHLMTLEGGTVCRSPMPPANGEETSPEWLERALAAQQLVIRPQELAPEPDSEVGQIPTMIATLPVFDREQRLSGLLAAEVPMRLLSLLTEEADLSDFAAIAIADPAGRILAQRSRGAPMDGWLPANLLRSNELATGAFIQRGVDGTRRVYVIAPLPGNLFGIYAQAPDDPSAGSRTIIYFLLLFPLLIWIAASLLAGWAADHMVIEPLNKVRQAIRRYIAGDDTARIERDDHAPVEVQAVAAKFNTLADAIRVRSDELRAAIDHQKALVREINHRVRNNLQVMNSLLNLQSRRAQTPEQAAIFQDVQRRLNALGIVHSAFYQGDDLRAVDLAILLPDLCQSTEQQLTTEWGRPVITMHCPEPIHALPDAALTLAFLVTELVAEAAQQVSPEGLPTSRFDFELLKQPRGGSVLTMNVDQPVLGELMVNQPGEVHIKLFRGLIRQLRARMEVDDDNCSVTVTLPPLA